MVVVPSGIPALALIASVATSSAFPAMADENRRFGDWSVACTAADVCRASTGDDTHLVLQRHRLSDHWELLVDTGAAGSESPQEFSVQVDDLIENFETHEEFGPYGRRESFYFLSEKAQDVLAAMIDGRTARFAYQDDADDTVVMEFSLVGLSASLLWIDERQQRVGSPRRAGDPPHGLLPFGPEIDEGITVPADLVQRHRAQMDCTAFEQLASGRDSIVTALDDEWSIAVLPCSDGAYNVGASVYLLEGDSFQQHYFAEYSDEESWFASGELMNTRFDRDRRELMTFNKSRGLGDCGSAGRWAWNRDGFRLEEYRYQAECDGTVEPGEFPGVFTAKPLAD